MRARCALLALVVAGLAPAVVRADIWTWDGETSELEVRNFYKSMATGLRLPLGLAEALEAPAYGALWTHTTRTWGHLVLRKRLELQAGWQLGALISSDRAFAGGTVPGSTVPLADAPTARRRLVDFDPVLLTRGGLSLYHDLDLLAIKVSTSHADVTVGRQVLSWGSGRLWNPTDLLSPFAPTDVDREVRRGVDAVRVSIPLAATAQLEVLWLPLPELRDNGGVVRAQVNVRGFDIAPSVAKYVRDAVFGLDVTGDAGPLGVHAEAAWTAALDRNDQARRDEFLRAVTGVDVRPANDLVLSAEYYFNGWGAADPSGYLAVLRSARVLRGEVFGAGRHYLGLTGSWMASGLLTVRGAAITNLFDPSLLIIPTLEYSAEQHVLVRAGGYLPLGRRSEPDRTTGNLVLRSDYGASPLGVFAQIEIYLL